jgi:hypothetical protein
MKSDVRRGDSIKTMTNEYFKLPLEKEAAFDAPKQSKRLIPWPKHPIKREARVMYLNFILLLR